MIRAMPVVALGKETRIGAVRLHDPEARRFAGARAAEGDLGAVRGFHRPEIPDTRGGCSEIGDLAGDRMDPGDAGAAAGEGGFEVAIEVVGVRALRLVLPGDLGIGDPAWEQDVSVAGPRGNVGTATGPFGTAVSGPEPHGLIPGQCPVGRSVRACDADVGPIMSRIRGEGAALVGKPLAIGGPGGPEIELIRLGGDEGPVAAKGVAGPDLITLRAGKVKGDAPTIGAQAQAIGKTFVGSGELAGIGAIELHVEGLAGPGADHLHEDAPVLKDQLRGVEDGHAIAGGQFDEAFPLQIVAPDMGRCEVIKVFEGSSGTVATGFHAEQEDLTAGEETGGLPRHLFRGVDSEGFEAGTVGVDPPGPTGRGEEQAGTGFGGVTKGMRTTAEGGDGGEGSAAEKGTAMDHVPADCRGMTRESKPEKDADRLPASSRVGRAVAWLAWLRR